MKKFLLFVVLMMVMAACSAQTGDTTAVQNVQDIPADAQQEVAVSPDAPVTLRIGATPVPHAVILEYIADDLAARGVILDIVEFTEFVLVNPALHDRQIDVNYFQHYPFLLNWIENSGNQLTRVADIHIEPMSIYSENLTDVSQVPQGGRVAIPNDAVNGGRALAVLESAGLIGITEGLGVRAMVSDIIYNPLGLEIIELEAPIVPVALGEVDIAVINTNFALGVGLNPMRDSLFMEDVNSPFANIVATRPENANDEAITILVETLKTERVYNFILERFEGAVVPVF
ncbi:MAG: MetQ/NlpA family ABC transporter substrate-binding protein [Defluviitaleaceae bacterium]|nr:MetQ/NlpA family ABC transporter substrate-binding protein [Defluviitaleaceae bacterium]MCL2262768.1 MetQ/NlpA family ABC transporter substrate-binding protein [Defluviitaleaceae bacterium]